MDHATHALISGMSDLELAHLITSLKSEQRCRQNTGPHFARPMWLSERDEARFRVKVGLPDGNGCMLWLKSTDTNGYGQFHLNGRTVKTHLVSWTLAYGEFPAGQEPDHTCRVRHCVMPDHLEWVTHAENVRRIALRREFCMAGLHRWSDWPVTLDRGNRVCQPCRAEARRTRYQSFRDAGMSAAEARRMA